MRRALMLTPLIVLAIGATGVQAAPAVETPLWPDGAAIAAPAVSGPETAAAGGSLVAGRPWTEVRNVVRPTLTVYPPKGANSGVAVLVFPGGGYKILAVDLEGSEVCDWLTAKGVTCAVLKYRVPFSGHYWSDDCKCHKTPAVPMALQDAQRAMGLLRRRASELHIDPNKIGVLGFSAGGHLVVEVSNRAERAYAPVDMADQQSSLPNFALALYPGHLWRDWEPGEPEFALNPTVQVSARTPPTFIVQAQDDPVDDVRNSLVYYAALLKAKAPVEMHLYAHGGHAFGLRRTDQLITAWPELAEAWLRSIGMLPEAK